MTAILSMVLALWFVTALIAGSPGVFQSRPPAPPLPILVAVVVPPLLFAIAYRASSAFRTFALGIDPRLLTAIQGWRVIGGMFLVLYAFGLLPGLFAWRAGVGDLAVGLAAPFVLLAMFRGNPAWPRQVAWLNIAGLIDFLGAVGTGVFTSSTSLGLLADAPPRASMGALPLTWCRRSPCRCGSSSTSSRFCRSVGWVLRAFLAANRAAIL